MAMASLPDHTAKRLAAVGHGQVEGLEVALRVVESGAGHFHVLVHYLLPLPGEAQFQAVLQYLEVNAQQRNDGSHHHRVLDEAIAALGQFPNGNGAQVAAAGLARRHRVAVEQHAAAVADVPLVAVHGVLVKAQQQVHLIAVAKDFLVADTEGEEDVAAADDGLVCVVCAEMQPAPHDYAGENVAGSSDTLACLSPDAHCEIIHARSHLYAPPIRAATTHSRWRNFPVHTICAWDGLSIPPLSLLDKCFA